MSIEIQRRNNKCIMDDVLQSNLTKIKLIQVNTCRVYLQFFYLSDIIKPDSKTVNSIYYSGKYQHTQGLHSNGHASPIHLRQLVSMVQSYANHPKHSKERNLITPSYSTTMDNTIQQATHDVRMVSRHKK